MAEMLSSICPISMQLECYCRHISFTSQYFGCTQGALVTSSAGSNQQNESGNALADARKAPGAEREDGVVRITPISYSVFAVVVVMQGMVEGKGLSLTGGLLPNCSFLFLTPDSCLQKKELSRNFIL